MNVVFAASEAVPFCKTGGLADVAGSLPEALSGRGDRVTLFLPYYRAVRSGFPDAKPAGEISVEIGGESIPGRLLRANGAVLIDCPRFFDRDGLYGDRGGEHPDNDDRFAYFSRAVLEGARLLYDSVDVFHVHDWQAALVPLFLKTFYAGDPVIGKAAAVLTIHNLAFQGNFPKGGVPRYGLPWSVFSSEGAEFYDQLSFLKAGIVGSDRVNAVSPTYAREITTAGFGCGLDGALRARGNALSGILNGIDTAYWNPAADAHLPRRYGVEDAAAGKAACKRALQEELGLEADAGACVFAAVTRVSHQKGLDLALSALERRAEAGDQFVLLGEGDPAVLAAYKSFSRRFPRRVHLHAEFDEPCAHRIYAGADVLVMPSRFEPCGLGQMIAMRYGTIPAAVATGGLADTVRPHGFLAGTPSQEAVTHAIESARDAFEEKPGWNRRVRGAMSEDFSWSASAGRYEALYREAVNVSASL